MMELQLDAGRSLLMTRHAFDAVSFAFGALFLIAGVMLLSGTPDADAHAMGRRRRPPLAWVCSSWSANLPVAAQPRGCCVTVRLTTSRWVTSANPEPQ